MQSPEIEKRHFIAYLCYLVVWNWIRMSKWHVLYGPQFLFMHLNLSDISWMRLTDDRSSIPETYANLFGTKLMVSFFLWHTRFAYILIDDWYLLYLLFVGDDSRRVLGCLFLCWRYIRFFVMRFPVRRLPVPISVVFRDLTIYY